MSEEREQALEQWRQEKEEPGKEEEPRKPVIHIFTEDQEQRFGVGPRLDSWSDPNNDYNPDDFVAKGVR